MRKTFYRSGEQLSVQGLGQPEGMQQITARRREAAKPCPKDGCERYEKGYSIVVNLHDPKDAHLARQIREGKAGRHGAVELEPGVVKFEFPPGECQGHRLTWEDELPVYFVGQRKTVHDEYHERYQQGAEALITAVKRKEEMKHG